MVTKKNTLILFSQDKECKHKLELIISTYSQYSGTYKDWDQCQCHTGPGPNAICL